MLIDTVPYFLSVFSQCFPEFSTNSHLFLSVLLFKVWEQAEMLEHTVGNTQFCLPVPRKEEL